MQPFQLSATTLLFALLSLIAFAQALGHENEHLRRQIAAGGGAAAATQAATQAPTVSTAASHVVVGTSTTVQYLPFTQTFASTALGTWAFGSVTSSGTIGLGTIVGTVGGVKKSKRAEATPAPIS